MKWLVLQTSGKPEAARLRECVAIQSSLTKLGHYCVVWGPGHTNFHTLPDFNSFDVILIEENYDFSWIPDLSRFNNPVVLSWIIDLHYKSDYSYIVDMSDIILHATRGIISEFSNTYPSKKHVWLPNAVNTDSFYPRECSKDIDCCFVGKVKKSMLNRRKILADLAIPSFTLYGEDMIKKISQTKIHFNISISTDINYRCFETIGLGVCLITNTVPDMDVLGFRHGYNCLLYDDVSKCRKLIEENLVDDRYVTIAKNAEKLAGQNTYTDRCSFIIERVL